jgi:hypothetical protein
MEAIFIRYMYICDVNNLVNIFITPKKKTHIQYPLYGNTNPDKSEGRIRCNGGVNILCWQVCSTLNLRRYKVIWYIVFISYYPLVLPPYIRFFFRGNLIFAFFATIFNSLKIKHVEIMFVIMCHNKSLYIVSNRKK